FRQRENFLHVLHTTSGVAGDRVLIVVNVAEVEIARPALEPGEEIEDAVAFEVAARVIDDIRDLRARDDVIDAFRSYLLHEAVEVDLAGIDAEELDLRLARELAESIFDGREPLVADIGDEHVTETGKLPVLRHGERAKDMHLTHGPAAAEHPHDAVAIEDVSAIVRRFDARPRLDERCLGIARLGIRDLDQVPLHALVEDAVLDHPAPDPVADGRVVFDEVGLDDVAVAHADARIRVLADGDDRDRDLVAGHDLVAHHVIAFEPRMLRARVDDLDVREADPVRVAPKEDVLRTHRRDRDLLEMETLEPFSRELPNEGFLWNLVIELSVALELSRRSRHEERSSRWRLRRDAGELPGKRPQEPSG